MPEQTHFEILYQRYVDMSNEYYQKSLATLDFTKLYNEMCAQDFATAAEMLYLTYKEIDIVFEKKKCHIRS